MEPSERELRTHFEAMEDHALLESAAERAELTEMAQKTLVNELERRQLPLPPIKTAIDSPAEKDAAEKWVTVDRFRDLSAGIVARSALEASDIPCLLRDENTVRMDWQISNFIGGMRLQVLEQDADSAVEVLRGLAITTLPENPEEVEAFDLDHCPTCGSTNVSRAARRRGLALASMIFFGLPLPRGRKTWKCEQCGAEWEDQA